MRRSTWLATIVLLLGSPPAGAEQVEIGVDFATEYDSRVLQDEGDVIWQTGPSLRLSGDRRRVGYSIEYRPQLEIYMEQDDFDAVRHYLAANGTWQIDARNRLTVSESFSHVPRVQSLRDDVPGSEDTPGFEDTVLEFEQNSVLRNFFSATWSSSPMPRIGTSVQVAHFLTEYDDASLRSQNTDAITLTTQATYQLAGNHGVGVGFRLQSRNFETGQPLEETTTNTYEVFGSWAWTIDERTSFSFQAGPAFAEDEIDDPTFAAFGLAPRSPTFLADPATCRFNITLAEQLGLTPAEVELVNELLGLDLDPNLTAAVLDGTCRPIAGQDELTPAQQEALLESEATIPSQLQFGEAENDSNVNIFFALNFQRQWDRLEFSTSWVRSNSETQGFGSATILDSFRSTLIWSFLPRWRLSTTFRFSRRFTDIDREVLLPIFGGEIQTIDLPEFAGSGIEGYRINGFLPVQQKLELTDDVYSLDLRLSREVGPRITIFTGAQYRTQESRTEGDDFSARAESDQYSFRIGFNYRFRPIRF